MRISGFSSGLDIDNMVKELMQAKREPLNKLNQQKQLLEWKREGYRELSTKMVSFRTDKLLDSYTSTFSMQAKKTEITGTNPNAVTATAVNSASNIPITVKVTQVASAANAQIQFTRSSGSGAITRDTTIGELTGGAAEITVNGVGIPVNSTDTIQTLASKINSSSANVTAAFDTATQKLYLTSKETGTDKIITTGLLLSSKSKDEAGLKAQYSINDVVQADSNSNVINYDGLTITLKETGTAVIQTKPDTDKLVDTIKSFISDYNSLISSLNSKLNEERYRKYSPLSDDQKKEMKDDEIELWQSKAKSGMLKNDDIVQRAVDNMRSAVTRYVDTSSGSININSIGIATGKWNEGGKLVIEDENKLRQALEQNPDQVLGLFTSNGSAPDGSDTGIFNRLSKILSTTLDDMAKKAGTSRISSDINSTFAVASLMGEEARNLDNRISDMVRSLTNLENTYYKQFTAMETAINRYNSQSGSLSSFLQ